MNSEVVKELKDEWVYEKRMQEGCADVAGPWNHGRGRNCADPVRGQVVEWRLQMGSLTEVENSSQ